MRAVAINVGANTNEPGFRGPVYPDGTFEYVPIPEGKPTDESVPTYGDLAADLRVEIPAHVRDVPVHLDPEFATYPHGHRYTYGDPHGVKAGPVSELRAGDYLLFYATLTTAAASKYVPDTEPPADWQAPEWGTYLVGHFRLARDALTGDGYRQLPATERERFASNAHCKRETFDARVLVAGDPEESRLYDRCVPLSTPEAGVDANRIVTDLSSDSGKGPWWRRPMRFEEDATAELLSIVENRALDRCLGG